MSDDAHHGIAEGTSLKVTLGGQLRELQRWVYAVPAIVVAMTGIYIWQSVGVGEGQSVLRADVVLEYGDMGSAVSDGQWWRAFTGSWLHLNLMHLVGNMAALAVIGRSVERMLGWRGFVIMYVLSGLGGSFATYLVDPYAMSIGASGAVYGVFGCVVGFTVRYPGKFPSEGLRTLMGAGLAYLLYSAAFGMGPGINWAAHGGGFVIGAVCGAALSAPIEPFALPGRRKRDAVLGLVGAAITAALLFGMQGRIISASDAVVQLFAREASAPQGELSAGDIDARIVPGVRSSRALIASLDRLPDHQRAALATVDRYLAARERAWLVLSASLHTGDLDGLETAHYLHERADQQVASLHAALAEVIDEPVPAPSPVAPVVDQTVSAVASR